MEMGTDLAKMRAQDLTRALLDYVSAEEADENVAWQMWNVAWERADDMMRRDALMIVGTQLIEARRELAQHESV